MTPRDNPDMTAEEWARAVLSEPDPEGCCLGCYAPCGTDDGCDPTPLCHHCAQEAARVMAQEIEIKCLVCGEVGCMACPEEELEEEGAATP